MNAFPVAQRRGPSAGWWGMAMLIVSESMLFSMMFGSYFYLRFKALHWPPPGIPEPKVVVPLVLLGVVLATSAPMQLAANAARRRRLGATRALILLALIVQTGYFAMQVHQYADDLSKFAPQQNAYASLYYTLLGADHAHVAVGLLLNLWLLTKLVGGFTSYRVRAVQVVAFYWHAVNLITLAITLAVLSPAL